MGYTHYLGGKKGSYGKYAEGSDFAFFAECVREAIRKEEKKGVAIAGGDGYGLWTVTSTGVWFNGQGGLGHETCSLSPNGLEVSDWSPDGFEFCKTARKPYDNAVAVTYALAALLLGVKHSCDDGHRETDRARKQAKRIIARLTKYRKESTV